MKIKINGYKNIEKLEYDIIDNKLNVLIGISGSGKSSIIGALKKDDIVFNKTINKEIEFKVDIGEDYDLNEISVFTENNIDKYLFSDDKNSNFFNVVIDDNNDYLLARKEMDDSLVEIKNAINEYNSKYDNFKNILKQLDVSLTQKTKKVKKNTNITRMQTSLKKLGNSSVYKKIENLDDNLCSWLIEGSSYINNSKCPFCEKVLGKALEKKLTKFKSVDIKSQKSLDLDIAQLRLLNLESLSLTINNLHKLEYKVEKLAYSVEEFEKFKKYIFDFDDFELVNETKNKIDYSRIENAFPEIIDKINQFESAKRELLIKRSKAISKTNSILKRKLDKINGILKTFGIPYYVKAKYSKNQITSYQIIHDNDNQNISREKGLSTGEKKIISLVFFLLETEKKDSKLIVLDDPISSYDDNRRSAVFSLINKHLKGKTILILSHDMLFAKLAIMGDKRKFHIGKVSYFENFKNPNIYNVEKDDFNNLSTFIKFRIKESDVYIQQIINLRYYFEINRDSNIYGYLSAIMHREFSRDLFPLNVENQIVSTINNEFKINLDLFDVRFYKKIKTDNFVLIEKIFLLRELSISKNQKDELSNLVHLNSKYAVSLNPYKFSFCSNYINALAEDHITKEFDFSL